MISLPDEMVRLIVSFVDPRVLTIDQRRALGIPPRRLHRLRLILPRPLRDVVVVPWRHRRCTAVPARYATIDYGWLAPSCPCGVDRSVVLHLRHPQSGWRVKTWILDLDPDGRFLCQHKYEYYVATYLIINVPDPGSCFGCSC
ncbi:hypothetical protein EBZ80_18760 [bacterium]|nr:hypothetical protein [bacterium]